MSIPTQFVKSPLDKAIQQVRASVEKAGGAIPVKLVVAIPNTGMVHTDFMMCLLHMTMFIMQNQLPAPFRTGNHMQVFTSRSSMLPKQRQDLARDAVEWGADWILFLDTDQLFPANTAHRLMQHGREVVACNIPTKLLPPHTNPNACQKNPADAEGGVFVYSTADKDGLEKV